MRIKKLLLLPFIAIASCFVACDKTPNTNETFKLTINDPGSFIYDKPENENQYYASGDIIKLHSKPINNVDLAMYIDGDYKSIQTVIEINKEYVWEYIIEMPNKSIVVDFRVQSNSSNYFAETKTARLTVDAYYTNHSVEYLLGSARIPFDTKDYGADYLLAGDTAIIKYRGEWLETESYPGQILMNCIIFVSIEVIHGVAYEYELNEASGGGIEICPINQNTQNLDYPKYVINEDNSYQEWEKLPLGSHLFGIVPEKNLTNYQSEDRYKVIALYSYNPLKKEREYLKDRLSWISLLNVMNEDSFLKPCMVIIGNYLGSVVPALDRFNSFTYSESQEDIERVMSYLNSAYIIRDGKAPRDGVGKITLTIATPTMQSGPQDYDYYTINSFDGLVLLNGEYCSLSESFPTLSHEKPYGNSFMITALFDDLKVVDMEDGEKDVTDTFLYLRFLEKMVFEYLGNFEFPAEINEFNRYKLQNSLGYIIFESESVFRLQTNNGHSGVYRIVNAKEANFYNLKYGPVEG